MNLKMIPTILVKNLIRIPFFIFSFLFPVDQKKVTFASYRSGKIEGNLLCIYNEFIKREDSYKYHFLFKKFNSSISGKITYVIHMIKVSYLLATSRFFIIDDFYFPVYAIKPREGTDIVQLWHAAGAFKKFGLSTIDKPFGPSKAYLKHVKIHSNYTRVYVSSSNVVEFYAEAFDMDSSQIYPFGIPRTDFFFKENVKEEAKRKFDRIFPEFQDKKFILYAPTFRGSSHYQNEFLPPLNIPFLKEQLGNEYCLLINLHPYMKAGLMIEEDTKDFAIKLEGQLTIEELLVISDILVTDYSSVIFDYSLLCRPIAFFAPDLEEYIAERDFYFDFRRFIPGPLFTDTESLAGWIVEKDFDESLVSEFRGFFFNHFDGKSSKRIVNHLLGMPANQNN
ncbi:CDP-glycerol glycerophosphotransferase family protein [Bacillus sp. ISL-35]|nr:CDP-glycerol glycerophosphotransferase family protein [Bacillus sp. ISL-35]MBT2703822.1 CDP-glycerol glycerophosphotransferase family protein [Chryseobacterium sp. ISL-80]